MHKKNIVLSVFAMICLTQGNVMADSAFTITSDDPSTWLQAVAPQPLAPLTALFEIKTIPAMKNPDPNKYYTATITVTNNSTTTIYNGWQVDFNFSSPDQTIQKMSNGVIVSANNPISIKNTPQLIRIDRSAFINPATGALIQVSSSTNPRIIYLLINKQPGSRPIAPIVTAKIL
jgi:hypothetical protein